MRVVGGIVLVVGMVMSLFGTLAPSSAASDTPEVILESGVSGCNGVLSTPGSENTTKRLDPDFPSDFNPGGVVGYIIDFPVDATDVSGRTTFVITDCVFVGGNAIAKYTVSFVPNTVEFLLRFSVPIPSDTALGAQFCNYAKTTAAPSQSQASNRKAGPACFTVGGGLRIEKRSGATTGPLLGGASFSVVCSPTVALPPTIITGLSGTSHTNANGTVSASGVSAAGSVAINGPSGTSCTVTETAAPEGYQLDSTHRTLLIPVGTGQTISVFVNQRLGDLVITKTVSGGTGTFTFDVDCTGTAFDQAVSIENNGSRTIPGIPVDTQCTVTERPNPLFASASNPANGRLTIASGANTVAFTNVRKTGDLVVTKATSGGSGTFTFDVDCSVDAFDQSVSITGSGSHTVTGIPTGTTCTVTERDDALFSGFSIPADGTVTIAVGENVVAFTNTRDVGNLVISKVTTGGTGTFTFDVDCDDDAFDQAVTITDSGSTTIVGIPSGTSCEVTERESALFTSVSVPADGTVTIGAGTAATVAFTNTARPTGISLDKKVNGGDHATTGAALVVHAGDPLRYAVKITNSGDVFLTIDALTDSLEPGFAAACPQGVGSKLAPGASFTCTYTSTAATSATNTASVQAADGLGRPSSASDSTFVKVIKAAIAIVKTATPATVSPGNDVTFTYTVTNTGDVTLTGVDVTDDILGGIGVVGTLEPGTSVTLTKTQTITADSPVRNVGTATGTDVLGKKVTATSAAVIAIVLGVVIERPDVLPRTGAPISVVALSGLALMLLGMVVLAGTRRFSIED